MNKAEQKRKQAFLDDIYGSTKEQPGRRRQFRRHEPTGPRIRRTGEVSGMEKSRGQPGQP